MAATGATTPATHPIEPEMPVGDAITDTDPVPPEFAASDGRPAWDSGRSVREFEAICAKSRLNCGSPEALAPFQRALDENKQLAMNFWSVVARLSDSANGPGLAESAILAAVVRAVTGQEIEQVRESQGASVDRLARLLAGEDLSLDAPLDARAPESGPQTVAAPSATADPETDTMVAAASEPRPATGPMAEQPDQRVPDVPRSPDPSARLVLSPEPPRSLAAAIAAASAMEPATPIEAPAASLESGSAEPGTQGTAAQAELTEEPRLFIPLSAYGGESHGHSRTSGSVAIAVLLMGLVCAGGFLLARNGAAMRSTVGSWLPSRSTAPQNSQPAPQPAIGPSSGASVSASAPATAPPASPSGAAPTTAEQRSATSPAPTLSATQPAPYPAAPHHAIPRGADAADSGAPADAARDAALPQVSADEMRDHLISSRFPIVPDAANADAISGVVLLHVVITANGTVEHAYAISGPESLRQPAIDAVSSWRYRPYLVDGTPTDVSTTIRVDFSGND